jgi:predicted PurR-regulated permease PerM
MHPMSELTASMRRHRQEIFALFMIAVVLLLLWLARGALPAFVIGLALAFVLDPGVTTLARRGVPRWAGVLILYAAAVAIIWALLYFVVPPITRQAREFVEQLPQLGKAIGDIERAIVEWYQSLPLPDEIRATLEDQLAASGQAIADFLAGLLAPTLNAVVRAATFLFGLVVIPVWLFFVLKDRDRFSRTVASAMPPAWRADAENMLALLGRVGGRWVRGQLLLGASIFLATAIGLTILTVIGFSEFGQFTLVLALIAGVLEWFPIIGPIVAAIPAILIGLSISPVAALAAVILYIVIQQLENNILVPKVMGDAVDLHPAVMILSLVIGGALFGIGGAILAAPTVAGGGER